MMQAIFVGGIEDVTKAVKSGEEIYQGQPVALDVNAQIIAATDVSAVYGLAKADRNQYADFTGAVFHPDARGGLKLTVVKKNVVQLTPNNYDVSPGTVLKYYVWDNTQVYTPMLKVMVSGTGKITPALTGTEVSILGMVTDSGTDFLEIDLSV